MKSSTSAKVPKKRAKKSEKTRREELQEDLEEGTQPSSDLAHLAPLGAQVLGDLTQGHRPTVEMTPEVRALFKSFQNNLVSLISHELRTPLMGVSNSLSLLKEVAEAPSEARERLGMSLQEIISMGTRNADRLARSLQGLLDAVALGAQGFEPRLRVVDPLRAVEAKLRTLLRDPQARLGWKIKELPELQRKQSQGENPLLLDPARFGRAVELWVESLLWAFEQEAEAMRPSFSELESPTERSSGLGASIGAGDAVLRSPGTPWLQVSLDSGEALVWELFLNGPLDSHGSRNFDGGSEDSNLTRVESALKRWRERFEASQIEFEGGIGSSQSLFSAVLGSETDFLARNQEGLGHELLMTQEILAKQGVRLRLESGPLPPIETTISGSKRQDTAQPILLLRVRWEFPLRTPQEAIEAILRSRVASVSHDLATVGVAAFTLSSPDLADRSLSQKRGGGAPSTHASGEDPFLALESRVRQALYRSTDIVYLDRPAQRLTVIIDDCKPEDFQKSVERLVKNVGELGRLQGAYHCPSQFLDPIEMLGTLQARAQT
jgi:signal transduction histidine kinase